tara:strand:+ start:485 stop:778 length:294 start_codon:yes stop_codon:yes gene_type:complete
MTTTKNKTAAPKIRWNDKDMRNTYANVCNVSSTKEEVTLLFGTNQAWRRGQEEIAIDLSDRIMMSPHAAKRLQGLLTSVLDEYESKFGSLGEEAKKT